MLLAVCCFALTMGRCIPTLGLLALRAGLSMVLGQSALLGQLDILGLLVQLVIQGLLALLVTLVTQDILAQLSLESLPFPPRMGGRNKLLTYER